MSRTSTVTETLTLIPSGYTGSSNISTSSSYPLSNGYADTSSTTYARLSLSASTAGHVYYTFDTSAIPSGATITSVTAKAKVRVSSTSRVTTTLCQLYSGSTAKGSNVTFASTSSSNVVTLTCGTWTASELSDLRMIIGGTGSSSSQSKYIYFYGAEVEVSYTASATEYEITVSNSTSATIGYEQWIASGADTAITADTLTGITVTDNGTDVTSRFVQGSSGTSTSYPTSYTTSGSISGTYYQSAIGNGSDAASASGNDYCSSSGSTAYIDYAFEGLSVPSGATIQSVSVSVKGHCEDTSQSSEVARCQLYSGSTAKGDALDFTSTSDAVYNMTTGTWAASELEDAILRFTIGYYGGRLVGATWTVTYEMSGYVYTITNIVADHAIVVSAASSTALYAKQGSTWVAVTAAYRKVSGSWQQVAVDQAFSAGTNYRRAT